MHQLIRLPGAMRFALVAALALLLSGCVIGSDDELIPESDAATPLPAEFYLFGYDDSDPQAYERSTEDPSHMLLKGADYIIDDASGDQIILRFAEIAGVPNTYAVSVGGGGEGYIYGIARYRDEILSVSIVLDTDDPGSLLEEEKASGAPGSAALSDANSAEGGGVEVTSRAALDYILGLVRSGKLPTHTVIAYLAPGADAEDRPHTIVPDGDFWKSGD